MMFMVYPQPVEYSATIPPPLFTTQSPLIITPSLHMAIQILILHPIMRPTIQILIMRPTMPPIMPPTTHPTTPSPILPQLSKSPHQSVSLKLLVPEAVETDSNCSCLTPMAMDVMVPAYRYIPAMRNLALLTAVGEHGDLGLLVQLLVDGEGVMLKVMEMVMPKWVPSDLPPLPKL